MERGNSIQLVQANLSPVSALVNVGTDQFWEMADPPLDHCHAFGQHGLDPGEGLARMLLVLDESEADGTKDGRPVPVQVTIEVDFGMF